MKINWKVRIKNPLFIAQVVMSILVPVLAYMGLTLEDLTTWQALGNVLVEAIANPYVLGLVVVSVFNCVTDPTTAGIGDSQNALEYSRPKQH